MSGPQIINDSMIPNLEIACVHDASAESVRLVLDAGVNDEGRSGWKWLRLRNGDLMLGVFPRGATYEEVEVDAQFPGAPASPTPSGTAIPERPVPVPDEWMVIDYRAPERMEKYYTARKGGTPLTARQPREKYTDAGGYWIVVPKRPIPIPAGWRVVAYREPVGTEQYFNESSPRERPYRRKEDGSGTTAGEKWIVVPEELKEKF